MGAFGGRLVGLFIGERSHGRVVVALIASAGLIALAAPATAAASGLWWSAPVLVDQQAPYDTPNSFVSVSCPSTSLCAAVDNKGNVVISTNATASTPTWSTPADIDGTNRFVAVSCPSTGLCVAVDQVRAFVSTNPTAATPTWTPSAQLEFGSGLFGFTGVSCSSTSLCVAVDYSDRAVISTDPTDATPVWSTPTSVDSSATGPLYGVSCASTTLCVAVENGGTLGTSRTVVSTNPTATTPTWSATGINGTHGLTSISCLGPGLCAAVDQSGDTVISTNPTNATSRWTVANVDSSNLLNGVSCASTSLCVAVDRSGNSIISTNPTAATPTWTVSNIAGTQALSSVSCVSGLCVATGGADALVSTDPTASTPTWTSATADSGGTDSITDISCGSTSFCMGVDPAGRAIVTTDATDASPSWTVESVDLAAYPHGVTKVSCFSTSLCVAIDGSNRSLATTDPTASTPTWTSPTSLGAHNVVTSVSCPSTTLCVAGDEAGYVEITTNPTAATPTWTATSIGSSISPSLHVSCASTSLCVAVDGEGIAHISTNPTAATPTWTTSQAGFALGGVSCPSASLCATVDSSGSGNIFTSTNPTAASPTWTRSANVDSNAGYVGISCGSTSLCAAIDAFGYAVASTDPSDSAPIWSSPAHVDTASTNSYENEPSAISCSSSSICVVSDQGGNVVIGLNTTPVPSEITRPTIAGGSQQGQTLTESHATWTNSPTSYSYQWENCDSSGNGCSAIVGATGQTYTLSAGDVGHTIRVQETASNAGGSSSPASSSTTGIVQPVSAPPSKPSSSSPPVISGTTTVGQTLMSSTGAWSGTPPIGYAHQWQRCTSSCSAITGATSTSYTLTSADVGARVAVVVTATNSAGSGQAISSQVGPVVAAGPTTGQIKAALAQSLAVSGKTARIAQLLKHGGYTGSFTAPSPGHLVISWYFVPKGAPLVKAKQKPVLVATASVTFHQAGKAKLKITLTRKGRKLLKGAGHLKLTEKGSFTPAGGTMTSTTKTFTLKP